MSTMSVIDSWEWVREKIKGQGHARFSDKRKKTNEFGDAATKRNKFRIPLKTLRFGWNLKWLIEVWTKFWFSLLIIHPSVQNIHHELNFNIKYSGGNTFPPYKYIKGTGNNNHYAMSWNKLTNPLNFTNLSDTDNNLTVHNCDENGHWFNKQQLWPIGDDVT